MDVRRAGHTFREKFIRERSYVWKYHEWSKAEWPKYLERGWIRDGVRIGERNKSERPCFLLHGGEEKKKKRKEKREKTRR